MLLPSFLSSHLSLDPTFKAQGGDPPRANKHNMSILGKPQGSILHCSNEVPPLFFCCSWAPLLEDDRHVVKLLGPFPQLTSKALLVDCDPVEVALSRDAFVVLFATLRRFFSASVSLLRVSCLGLSFLVFVGVFFALAFHRPSSGCSVASCSIPKGSHDSGGC